MVVSCIDVAHFLLYNLVNRFYLFLLLVKIYCEGCKGGMKKLATILLIFILIISIYGCGSDTSAGSITDDDDDNDDNDSEGGASVASDMFDTDTLSSGDWTLSSGNPDYPALTDPDSWLAISGGVLTFTAPGDYILAKSIDGGDGTYGIRKTFSYENLQATVHYVSANNLEYYGPPGNIVDGVYLSVYKDETLVAILHWHMNLDSMSCVNDFYSEAVSILEDEGCPADPGPAWLRIVKEGNTITGYYSADGSAFIQIGESLSADMGDLYSVDLMFASGEDSTFTVSVDSVTFE